MSFQLGDDTFGDLVGHSPFSTFPPGELPYPQSSVRGVADHVITANRVAEPNLSGIKWAWFDQARPDLLAGPTDQGAAMTTNGSGVFTITLVHTTKTAGQTGWLFISDSDGAQSTQHRSWCGPLVVGSSLVITGTLKDRSGVAWTSLTGLKWAWFDQVTPNLFAGAADKGSTAATDANGDLVLAVNSGLLSGQTGWFVLSNSDGTATQSPSAFAFAGPMVLN